MKKTSRAVTAEEFLHMPGDGVLELVRGEVREMPPAGAEHGDVAGNIFYLLKSFVSPKKLGKVFAAETGFFIARDPDTVRGPDCAFVRADRLPRPLPRGFLPFAPDIAVEVLSPDNRPREVREKVEQFLAAGSRLVWVLDPERREVAVHRTGAPPQVLAEGGFLGGEDVLPGFSVPVADLFE